MDKLWTLEINDLDLKRKKKLASQVSLDEGSLASSSVSNQHQLESGHILTSSHAHNSVV